MSELPPPQVDPERARDIADQVLSGPAYVRAARPPSLRERFFNWLGEVVSDFFGSLSSVGGRGPTAWIVIALFVALIIFLLTRLSRFQSSIRTVDADRDIDISISADVTAREWIERATAAEAAGDWRAGLRSRYRALIAELVSRDIVRVQPGQTAGEISRSVTEVAPAVGSPFEEATWLFKDVWYGWVPAGPEQRDRFKELADEVLTAPVPAAV